MKILPFALLLIGLLITTIRGEEKRRIVLHAVKIVKVDAFRAFVLEDDYGYVVLNDGTEGSPNPRYILGSQREGTVIHYSDKKEFLAAIAKIPKGAILREYEKCLAPLSWGLTEEQSVYKDVPKIAKANGINFTEDSKVYCNCPSSLTKQKQVEQGVAPNRSTAPLLKPESSDRGSED